MIPFFQKRRNRIKGLFRTQAGEFTGVNQHTFIGKGRLANIHPGLIRRRDHLQHGQAVFARKLPVALIVGRHRHHRAFAVTHEYEVGDKHRQLIARNRMHDFEPRIDAFFLHGFQHRLGGAGGRAFLHKGRHIGILRGGVLRQWMFRRHRHIGRAHEGVRTRGEDFQLLIPPRDIKGDFHAFRAPNPVALHGRDLIRPALQFVQIRQQLLGIGGDLHEPLGNVLAFDLGITAPAAAVDHLLIGQYGDIVRAPVHRRGFLVHQPLLIQTQEQPLLPAIIVGIAGGQFPIPVIGQPQTFELTAHVVDVVAGPGRRGDLVFHRRIFRRQAEGVPAHGLQHVLALHALIAADHVADGVVAHVAHVQAAAGIGEHGQAVEFLLLRIFHRLEGLLFFPVCLGLLFNIVGLVTGFHQLGSSLF